MFSHLLSHNKLKEIDQKRRDVLTSQEIVNLISDNIRTNPVELSRYFTIPIKNYWEMPNKYGLTIAMAYVKAYKAEPPFKFYHGPNVNINGVNLERTWRKFVNNDVPFEMVKQRYYEFMRKNNGRKKPENITGMYVYISNCTNSKMIFIDDKLELGGPAKKVGEIPVPFEDIKTYLIGELDMNNTCLLDKFTSEEWTKTTGNPECLNDCIVISDEKNVYRERTPILKLINWFIECIGCKFDVEIPFDSKTFKL